MSAAAQIDYGAHAPVDMGGIDYGAHAPAQVPPKGDEPATAGGVASLMANQAGRFLGAAWENVNPANLIKAGLHPIDTAHAMFGATVDAIDRTEKALKAGDHGEALTSAVGAIPLLGPSAEQIVREIQDGKHAEALGHAAGLRLAMEAPNIIKGLADKAAIAKEVLTDPEVVRAGVKVLPKGPAMVSAYDTIKGAIDRAKGVESAPIEAAPIIPAGVPPDVWEKLSPAMQDALRQKIAGQAAAPASASTPLPPRDPSHYGIEPTPAAQASPEPPATTPGIGNGEAGRPPLAETPGRIPEDTALTEKLRQLNREWAIKAGLDPDQHLGMLKGGQYTARFDAGDPNSPIIDSTKRKPYSTAEVANPQLITKAAADKVGGKLAGVVSPEQFDKMVKNPAVRDIISNLAGQEADAKLLSAIRRRIAKNPGQAPTGYTIADLMKDIK